MTTHRSPIREQLAFWAWLTLVIVLALIFLILATAATVRHALLKGPRLAPNQAALVLSVAEYPSRIHTAALEIAGVFSGKSHALVMDRKSVEQPSWQRIFPAPADSGYLLLSGVDPKSEQSSVRLIRIADGKTMARWTPDWIHILARASKSSLWPGITLQNVRAMHPLLLPDGDIIFNTFGTMVRQGPCNGKPAWILDGAFHHSNQRDAEGNIWTPSIGGGGYDGNANLAAHVRDDAIARISPDGRLLDLRSFARIMRENGLEALLFGTQGKVLNADPIHINEIAIAPTTTAYWQSGDLLISARHLSTLFLYRPSTGRIIWHRTGPWLNQHAPAFVDDYTISVLNNNVIAGAPRGEAFIRATDTNQFMLLDFRTGQVTRPFKSLLAVARPVTMTEGRARRLPDGGLFFEESNTGRIMRFTKDRLLWSFVNDIGNDKVGMVSWSRYISAEDAAPALDAISARHCAVGD